MVLPHVYREPSFLGNLLQLSLSARSRTERVQTDNDPHHGSHRSQGGILTQATLRAKAIVKVGVKRAVKANLVRRWECLRVTVCLRLYGISDDRASRLGNTYRADKHLVASLDTVLAGFIRHVDVIPSLAVNAQVAVQADSLQAKAGEPVISFRSVLVGQAVDLREILLALGQVEVDDLGELFNCQCCT